MMATRIVWADYVKAVCIFLVVLLHAGIEDPWRKFIRVFVIAAFFFISGLFFNAEKYPDPKSFFKHRLSKLLIPYFCFNAIAYLFWLFIGRHFGLDADAPISPLRPLLGIVSGSYHLLDHYKPFWFLSALVSVECLAYFLFKLKRSAQFVGLLCCGLLAFLDNRFHFVTLPWGINISWAMILFFALGFYARPYVSRLQEKAYRVPLMLVSMVAFCLTYYCFANNAEVLVYIREYGNFILFLTGAVSGITFLVTALSLLAQYLPNIRFMQFIGRNTLLILVLHLMAFSLIKAFTVYVLKLPLSIYDTPWGVLGLATAALPVLSPVIVCCNRYFPFLLGKKRAA